jgi:hypothetical protein
MRIQVEYRSERTGEIHPERFFVGKRPLGIVEVIDRWIAPHLSYFKVKAEDDAEYILRWDTQDNSWEITLFRSSAALALTQVKMT